MENVVASFIGKHVRVEDWDATVEGELVSFQESNRNGHIPNVLLIRNENGLHVVRRWHTIKILGN